MKVLNTIDNNFILQISKDERRLMANSINETIEALFAIYNEPEFAERTSLNSVQAEELHLNIRNLHFSKEQDVIEASFSKSDLVFLYNTIGIALEAIDEWEFSIRLGNTIDEAKLLRSQLKEILGKLQMAN